MDNFLFASIYSLAHKSVFLDTVIILFARWWEIVVLSVFLIFLWSRKRNQQELRSRAKTAALALTSAVVARFGFVGLIRYLWPRSRPFIDKGLNALIEQNPLEASFPSGHATFFMALAVYLLLAGHKKLGWFLFVSAVLIGWARVAAGVHWPSDILAGWALGAVISWLVYKVAHKKKAV